LYEIATPGIAKLRDEVTLLFKDVFQREPTALVLAPGRVNLIGEHIDYNEGIVLPFALDLHTAVAIAPSLKPKVRLISSSDGLQRTYPLNEQSDQPWEEWTRYVQGVWHYWQSQASLRPAGFDLAISSSLPMGAGLSSSAALCVATLLALQKITEEPTTGRLGILSVLEQATLCQQVEHHFAGVRCGLMDQLASLACQAGNLLAIDFRGPVFTQIPWPDPRLACLLIHTGVQHQLASTEYGKRRSECESATRKLGLRSLRDCEPGELEKAKPSGQDSTPARSVDGEQITSPRLTSEEYLRARHVVSEIRRTELAIDACRSRNATELGQLMNSSHQSLRTDYAVSCEELDYLVNEIQGLPGVLGARMTGGGFGGSMIALLAPEFEWKSPLERLLKSYQQRFDVTPRWLLCRPSSGALELEGSQSSR
jgi:galactokinase